MGQLIKSSKNQVSVFALRWLVVFAMLVAQFTYPLIPNAHANPSGGTVTHGSASISGQGSSNVTINQSSNRAVINWNNFSVGAGEKTTFVQPGKNSVAFNRVTGAAPSQILGSVSANGKIIIANQNGVVFGKGSKVDAAGLVATTHDADSNQFMNGGPLRFNGNGGNAAVVNEGTITIKDSGVAAFVAPNVRNAGVIQADLGKVALGAGKGFTLDLYGDNLVSFAVGDEITETLTTADGVPVKALVENSGVINAGGGQILLTATAARDVMNQAVNVTGSLKANSATKQGGKIILSSSNRHGQSSGVVKVEESAVISATGKTAGGTIQVLGQKVDIQKATIDASGQTGGGQIRIGGDKRGASTLIAADNTVVSKDAKIKADAVKTGNGGDVVVWANGHTDYKGEISARGGSKSGDGGFIEVSGKESFVFEGGIDLTAAQGAKGSLLLDPARLYITRDQGTQDVDCSGNVCTGPIPSFLNADDLEALLAVASVFVEADNITVNTNIYWSTDSLLMLDATAFVTIENGAKIVNNYNGEFAKDRIPVLLAIRTNSDSANDDGDFYSDGGIDFSNSTGAVSIFHDRDGSFTSGAFEGNGAWVAPDNHTVSSQFTVYGLVHSVFDLVQAIGNDIKGTYALAGDFDGGGGSFGKGVPINYFEGILDGQYCALKGKASCGLNNFTLTQTGDKNFGFFHTLEAGSEVRNLNLNNFAGKYTYNGGGGDFNAGSLAGLMNGTIANVNVSGTIQYGTTVDGTISRVGGLVGAKEKNGNIYYSSADMSMVVDQKASGTVMAGGLVGYAYGDGSESGIYHSTTYGDLWARSSETVYAGGVVGQADNFAIIDGASGGMSLDVAADSTVTAGGVLGIAKNGHVYNSHSSGNILASVTKDGGTVELGGLVGALGTGDINNSYGTGNIDAIYEDGTMTVFAGGLMGVGNNVNIYQSYAAGSVTTAAKSGEAFVGGLAGINGKTILESFSASRLSVATDAKHYVGGLVGWNKGGVVAHSYAVGKVAETERGYSYHGGLIGMNSGNVEQSFSTTYVEYTKNSNGEYGGFIGYDEVGVDGGMWDIDTSGMKGDSSKSRGMTTEELQKNLQFDGSVWGIIENVSYPYLQWQLDQTQPKPKLQVVSGYAFSSDIDANQGLVDVMVSGLADGNSLNSILTGGAVYTGANGYYYYLVADGTISADNGTHVVTYLPAQTGIHFRDLARDNIKGANIYDNALSTYTNETVKTTDLFSNLITALGTDTTSLYSVDGGRNIAMTDGVHLMMTWMDMPSEVTIDSKISADKSRLYLTTNGTVGQTTNFNADQLVVAGGVFVLDNASNDVNFLRGSGDYIAYNANSVDLSLGGLSFNRVDLNATGTVTETDYLYAGYLLLTGAGGRYYLNNGGAGVSYLAANTGTVDLNNGGYNIDINSIGGVSGVTASNFYLTTSAYAGQSNAINATNLYLGSGTFTLTNTGNAITTLAANANTVNFVENSGYAIGSVNGVNGLTATNAYLSSTGTVTQSQAINATNLLLAGANGSYTLTNTSNAITTLAANTGTVNFLENSGFAIGSVNGTNGITATNAYLSSTGTVTQSQRISATNLLLAGTNGTYTLTNTSNAITTLASNTGTVSFLENSGFDIGSINGTNGLNANAITLSSTGTVTQSQRVGSGTLLLQGTGGIYNLTNTSNNIATLAANTGTVNFLDNTSGFAIGSVGGVNGVTATNAYFSTTSAVTQSQALTATSLSLAGTGGAYTLTNTGNNVGTMSANTGSVSLNNGTRALTVGAVNSVNGITTTGATSLVGAGLITLNQGITAGGAGNSLVLSGTGFDNNAGASALNAGSGGGRFLVWSTTPVSDDRGGIAHSFKQYNASYGVTAVAGTGSGFLYTLAPTVSTSLTGAVSKVYDSTNTATLSGANFGAVTGAVDGDTVTFTNPTSGTFNNANAGTGKTVTASASTINSATNGAVTVYGYQVGATAGAAIGEITARQLTVAGNFTANNKTYDSTTGATFLANGLTLVGVQGSDNVTLSGTTIAFADANKGTGKTVLITGSSLGGTADLNNYTLSFAGAPTTTANIAARALTVGGNFTANGKEYDATTAASFLTNGLTLVGVQGSENVTLTGTTIAFADANKGNGKAVSITGGALGGTADLNNYTLSFAGAPTTTANIAARALTIGGGFTAGNKDYDGTTAAAILTNGLTLVGVQNGEDVTLSGVVATFADANKGNGKTVSISNATMGGSADLSNYTFSFSSAPTTTANIAARVLTVGGTFTAGNKDYDATTAASILTNGLTLVGVQNGEDVTLAGANAAFADANKGSGKTVTLTGVSLGGTADLGNYTLDLTGVPATTADIAARVLTIGGTFTVSNKVFDNTTNATIGANNLALVGVQGGENVTLSAVASFDTAAYGSGKSVNLNGSTLAGTADLNNYTLSFTGAPAALADVSNPTPPPPVVHVTPEVQAVILTLANPTAHVPTAPVVMSDSPIINPAPVTKVVSVEPAAAPAAPAKTETAAEPKKESNDDGDSKGGGKTVCPQNVRRGDDSSEISISCSHKE